MEAPKDHRRQAPAAGRNRDPILTVLRQWLPADGAVLEVASGTGEHAAYFAKRLPGVTWQPSDPDPDLRDSIAAWRDSTGAPNLLPPVELDARDANWPVAKADAIVCINMIHIAPWEATEGLVRGAASILSAGGVLYLYGPFRRGGSHTAPSNAAFDESLRARDPRWGVRDVDDVSALARDHGLELAGIVEMPANNLSVIFRRR